MSLLSSNQIKMLLQKLNEELKSQDISGEICLYGGSVMCLVYNARAATKDIDAIFEPTVKIRESIQKIAEKNNLRQDWLNDALKGFLTPHHKKILFNWDNLKVFVPEPDYLLAMKCLASRVDTHDKDDIIYLIKLLKLNSPEEVFSIIENYYPKNRIKPVTQFFVEEIFADDND
ncbi:MAG: DUF6036 family nucleotidyltransferase [Spirochaetota bacterium]